jgi:IMP dehydrogenase
MTESRAVDAFMSAYAREGLTFDDVSLLTRYADFLPRDTDLTARLTRGIAIRIPFLSAAMDTVTEHRMAIAMAMLGGLGVIHKNLSVQQQSHEVELVKNHLNGLIRNPVTFRASDTLRHVRETRLAKGYKFSGFPVLDDTGRLAGILTAFDLKFTRDEDALVRDVMVQKVITAPADTTLHTAFDIMRRHKIGKLPLVQDGRLVGLYSYSDVRTLIENAAPQYNRDAKHRLRAAAAVGPGDQARVEALAAREVDVLVLDTAHGHSKGVLDMCRWIKQRFPAIEVIAGNIVTAEAALALRDAGADAVKVGVGPGSICTTRVVAGVGIPQISAIHQVATALRGELPLIADGGIRYSGDVPKALAAGADTIMMGSILAGTDESPGEKIIHQGRQYVVYRGMGSLSAMKTSSASRERYGQADADEEDLVPQGVEGMVPYNGTVEKVMAQFCGGLRVALGYCGCRTLSELQRHGSFIRVSPAGVREAHPHDIRIIKDAPNYSMTGAGGA